MLTDNSNVEPIYVTTPQPNATTRIYQEENRLGVPRPTRVTETLPIHSKESTSGPDNVGKRHSSKESESPGRNSGVMVEEEPENWLKDFAAPKITHY